VTIIIGYDGSEGAKGAIRFAGEHFSGRDAIVVTAFEDWPPAVQGDAVEVDDAVRAKAEDIAKEGAALALQRGINAEARTVYTAEKAWQSIIRVADEVDAGLIVVGSHGFNGLRPLVLGSVSHQLAHHAHQPVIAVPTPEAVVARREQKKDPAKETTAHTH
jgi:nucleotide-binding universal stress UspA family protein